MEHFYKKNNPYFHKKDGYKKNKCGYILGRNLIFIQNECIVILISSYFFINDFPSFKKVVSMF